MRSRTGSGAAAAVRAVSGVLTGGLVVLAAFVVLAAIVASRRAVAGPTPSMVVLHVGVALAAVFVQVLGDRRGSVAAGVGVLALSAVLLWTQWWA